MKKILLITGSSSGIGAAIAKLAAASGYSICINYKNNAQKAEGLRQELSSTGAEVIAIKADISREFEVIQLFEKIDSQLGEITHLVNNAGVISPIKKFEDTSLKDLHDVFSINVFGSFLCAREAVKRMSIKNGGSGGVIVNISSVASKLGSPYEFIDYAASKGAIDTFTIGLSKEVAELGIRVNAIRPGLIQTEMHARAGDAERPEKLKHHIPIKRAGSSEEVANAVMWLLGDSASYVTGALLDVSGGR